MSLIYPWFRTLVAAAAKATDASYRDALASSILGEQDQDVRWQIWGEQYAAAVGLAYLTAQEKIVHGLRLRQRELFSQASIIAEGITVAPFIEMLNAMERRTPFLSDEIRRVADRVSEVAANMAASESTRAIAALAERSEVFRRAFFVTGLDIEQTNAVKETIANHLRRQSTDIPESLAEFIDTAQLRGASKLSRARLETVLRTNMTTAAVDGQRASYRTPEVKRVAPLVMLLEIDDRRSRPTHLAMDGYVNTEEMFTRYGIWPPAGYNCRGSTRPVSIVEAIRKGVVSDSGVVIPDRLRAYNGKRQAMIDRGLYPDPEFRKVA